MAYSDFTATDLRKEFGIKFKSEDNADLFLHRLGLSLDLFIKAWPK